MYGVGRPSSPYLVVNPPDAAVAEVVWLLVCVCVLLLFSHHRHLRLVVEIKKSERSSVASDVKAGECLKVAGGGSG